MDVSEVEENLFAASDAKLHGVMCKQLSTIYCKMLSIFPSLEAARPRSRSGIQTLCSLHIALEKAKNILQHCSECSKLYLAITGDSVLLKFEKARCSLVDSLKRVENIIPQTIGCQVSEITSELENTVFSPDPSEKEVGDELIALLQQGRKFDNCSDSNELELFHQAASRLGITSSRAALTERRALKKLMERARSEEDKRKEQIVAYLLHLMRKYSKVFRSDFCDDSDSQGSAPCSPTGQGSLEADGTNHIFERQLTKLGSFNFNSNIRRSGSVPVPPEELRCPISLQLMYDPVIISSGQTFERICIEKWFSDEHDTCPKTQQKLPHLDLIPNYCVKGYVTSWCEQNGVSEPNGPPDSLDLNYWRLALSEPDTVNLRSVNSVGSCKLKVIKVDPLEETVPVVVGEKSEFESECPQQEDPETNSNVFERYHDFLSVLTVEENMKIRCEVVEQIRFLLKEDEEARIFMGANGFIEALLRFLQSAVTDRNSMAQENGAMALFNLAVNNNRNKEMMLAAGVIELLEKMISSSNSHGSATALYLNLSCLEEAKPIIGSSRAIPFLVQCICTESEPQRKLDALHALYNLSTHPPNIPNLLAAGIVSNLHYLLPGSDDQAWAWTEKSIAVLINLASNAAGKEEIVSSPSLIGAVAMILDNGEAIEQEQAASCLFVLCNGDDKCIQMVLQEGVIPALVSLSMNGTFRGKEKAQKLLMLFREQRQRDQPPDEMQHQQNQPLDEKQCEQQQPPNEMPKPKLAEPGQKSMPLDTKSISKSSSRRTMGKAFSFFSKNKSYSVHQQ